MHKLGFAPQRRGLEKWRTGWWFIWSKNWKNIFLDESMFSKQSNASKYAFIKFVEHLKNDGVELMRLVQVYTEHLESLGARMIPRNEFIQTIEKADPARLIAKPAF